MNEMIRLKFGKNIRKYRIKRGLTQEGLAEATGIDYKYIQRIEGKKPPNVRIETVAKFAKALKIASSNLI